MSTALRDQISSLANLPQLEKYFNETILIQQIKVTVKLHLAYSDC